MAVQSVSNVPLGSYPVLVDKNTANSEIQVVRLDLGIGTAESRLSTANAIPITGSVSLGTTLELEATYPKVVAIPTADDTTVLAALSGRDPKSFIQNLSSIVTIEWTYGTFLATPGEAFLLAPGEKLYTDGWEGAITMYQASGGTVNVCVASFT